MKKKYVVKLYDNKSIEHRWQRVRSDAVVGIRFFVSDLDECPEDAIIGRDLFDAYDYINTLKLGFHIAKLGYDEIVVEEEPLDS